MYYADPPSAPPPPSGPGGLPPAPPGSGAPPHQGQAPVLMSFDPPAPQSRGTVAIRILLAIPHLIVLYALGIAAEVIAIIGWFAALFTGRLPEFAGDFLTGYLRWQTRVYAYVALLTGVYPPFALADVPYPVRIATLPGGRLNRLAVLFRAILVIPAGLVLMVLSYGAFTVMLFVGWLITLFTGRLPGTVHQAYAASIRYSARVSGYLLLLTSAYPGGLFGDQSQAPTFDQVSDFPLTPASAVPPDPWTLVLSSSARKLVIWFLVIGGVFAVGGAAGASIAASNAGNTSKANALKQVKNDANQLNQGVRGVSSAAQACGNNLSCVTKQDTEVVGIYRTFASNILSVPMPAGAATTDAASVAADANKLAGFYDQLGHAKTSTAYLQIVSINGTRIQSALSAISSDYVKLENALGAS